MSSPEQGLERSEYAHYEQLVATVDRFFARVAERYSASMACETGCSDCCHADLTVTKVEGEYIASRIAGLPDATRTSLRARAEGTFRGRCLMLDDDGRCAIYAFRPLVCRTHGLQVRMRSPKGLPMLETCFRNFTDGAALPSADQLDQETLSTALLQVEVAHARASGRAPGTRVSIVDAVLGSEVSTNRGPT